MTVVYDPTAGYIETPQGPGRFVEFDAVLQQVTVEMDHQWLVVYDASVCFVPVEGRSDLAESSKSRPRGQVEQGA